MSRKRPRVEGLLDADARDGLRLGLVEPDGMDEHGVTVYRLTRLGEQMGWFVRRIRAN